MSNNKTKILNSKIEELDFSMKLYSSLKRIGIKSVNDIISHTSEEIKKARNFDQNGFEELENFMNQNGLFFKENSEKKEKKEGKNTMINTKIKDLGLSIRTYNALRKAHFKTVKDIIERSRKEFRKVRNFGSKSYDELINCIHAKGLKFADETKSTEINPNDLRNKRISSIELSSNYLTVRTYNCLLHSNIITIGDLVSLTTTQLKKIENLGSKSFEELVKYVHNSGLRFSDETEELIQIKDKVLTKRLSTLLSTRTYNTLKKAHITNIEKLISYSIEDLNDIKNLGAKSVKEIVDSIHGLGLEFANERVETKEEVKPIENKNEVLEQKEVKKTKKSTNHEFITSNLLNSLDFWIIEEIQKKDLPIRSRVYEIIDDIVEDLSDLSKDKVCNLNEKVTNILRYRLGIITGKQETYESIGKILNVQPSRIIRDEIDLYRFMIAYIISEVNKKPLYSENELLKLDVKTQCLFLSRIEAALKKANINKVKDLVSLTTEELCKIGKDGLGSPYFEHVIDYVHNMGLNFKDEEPIKKVKVEEPVEKNKVIEEPVEKHKVIEEPVEKHKVVEEPVETKEVETSDLFDSQLTEICSEIDNTIETIRKEKQTLLDKYNSLLAEKKKLEDQMKELDVKINNVVDDLSNMNKRYLYGKN